MGIETSTTALAISSSTDVLSLALRHQGQTYTQSLQGGPQASSQILPLIQSLCEQANCRLHAVQSICVDRGPGAFTGVRVAVAVGQGLAVATGAQVYAFSSLQILTEQWQPVAEPCEGNRIWALLDARMGQVYAAPAVWREGHWQMQEEILLDYAQVEGTTKGESCIGNIASVFAQEGLVLPDNYAQAQPEAASMLAMLAQPALAAAAKLPQAADLLPVYVRNKVAQTTAEREAAKAAAVEAF